MSTKIEWTDITVNPFPGCRKVSPGCHSCYAEKMAQRLKAMGQKKYQDVVDAKGWTGKVGRDVWSMVVPGFGKMVFVNSMGDLFYEGVPFQDVELVFEHIREQRKHTFQMLTKRPQRVLDYWYWRKHDYLGGHQTCVWPDNCWLGVTAENQEWADKRIPLLLQIPAAVRFVSLEPLLGPVHDHSNAMFPGDPSMARGWCWGDLSWAIVGPETGPGRRPCQLAWIESIVDQCHAAGVPVFVKALYIKNRKVTDPNTISNMLGRPVDAIRQFPLVAASSPAVPASSETPAPHPPEPASR